MNSDRVLVTGGAGFIGSFLVDDLVAAGNQVTVLDVLDPQVHGKGKPSYANPSVNYIRGDVRDQRLLAQVVAGQDVVYHLAAAVGVGQSQYQIDHYVDVNTRGTAVLLDYLVNHTHSLRKLVVAASMSSYGEGRYRCEQCGFVRPGLRPEIQMQEGHWELICPGCQGPLVPVPTPEEEHFECNSIYAMTKAHQEEMTLNIGRTYGIPAVATRFFNVYGPRQSLSNPYTGVSAIFMSRIKNDHAPVVYEDGLQTRDFISVHDIARALVMVKDCAAVDGLSLNLGTGNPMPISDVARTIAQVCGKDIEPDVQNKFRKGDVRHCYADITRARTLLGWEPQVSFKEGITELVAWSETVNAEDRFEQAAAELRQKGLV